MEGFLKNKDVKEVHAREREEIERFYKEDTKDLMEMYDTQLMGMYKYYTLQGNIPLEGNIEKRMNAIEFNNWVKFGYNTNITPHLVSSEDIVSIYRILEREMDKNVKGDTKEGFAKYIDYEHFKKGLIRITILWKTQKIETEVKNRAKRKINKKNNKDIEQSIYKSPKLKELESQIAKIENLQKIKVEEK